MAPNATLRQRPRERAASEGLQGGNAMPRVMMRPSLAKPFACAVAIWLFLPFEAAARRGSLGIATGRPSHSIAAGPSHSARGAHAFVKRPFHPFVKRPLHRHHFRHVPFIGDFGGFAVPSPYYLPDELIAPSAGYVIPQKPPPRMSCQHDKEAVPSANGGTREVLVTRC